MGEFWQFVVTTLRLTWQAFVGKRTRDYPPISVGPPELGELVDFYARLSEPPNVQVSKEFIEQSIRDSDHHIFLVQRNKVKKLVGFLRAWRAPVTPGDQSYGVVYEVAVHGDYRGFKIGKNLVKKLRDLSEEWEMPWECWVGNASRVYPTLDRELTVIRNLFGICLIFGFQKVVDSVYGKLVGIERFRDIFARESGLSLLLALLLATLGIRFFWAVGNLKRCVLHRLITMDPPKRGMLVLHIFMLSAHAIIFFALGRLYYDICQQTVIDKLAFKFISACIVLLAVNSAWLFILRWKRTDLGPDLLWMANNALFALVGAACFWVPPLLHHPSPAARTRLMIAAGLLFTNSLIDFILGRGAYILSDPFGVA